MPLPIDRHKDIKAAKIDPELFTGDSLGSKFGNTLLGFFKRAINGLTDWFEERLINFAVGVLVKIETSGKSIFAPLIKELKDKKAIPDFLKPIFDEIENPKHEIGALLGGAAGSTAIGGLFGALFDPLMANVKYGLNSAIEPYIPGISEIVMAWRRGDMDYPELLDMAAANGFSKANLSLFQNLSRSLMGFADIRDSYLRGDITDKIAKQYISKQGYEDYDVNNIFKLFIKIPSIAESIVANFRGDVTDKELSEIANKNGITKEFLDILVSANRRLFDLMDIRSIYYRENKPDNWLTEQFKKQGYTPEAIEDIKKILPYFPGVPDLIRFAVREVYSPEIVSKYGQMEDLPAKFVEEAKKAGLPEDQAKNFWAAHWELPGFREGAEMLHRGVITYEDLMTLLRTLDVMPYWRDKIIKIAYSPYTRVDVRRMFTKGILTRDEVKKGYKDIGYDEEHAENLTLWTESSITPAKEEELIAEKDLTKADILEGYERKYFTLDDTMTYLQMLGYDQAEAEYFISKVDYKREKDDKKQMIDLYADMYKKGIVDDNATTIALAGYGVTTPEITYYLNKWALAIIGKPAIPSMTDLKNWLKAKVVDRNVFIEEASNLGYAEKYIDCYLREAKYPGL